MPDRYSEGQKQDQPGPARRETRVIEGRHRTFRAKESDMKRRTPLLAGAAVTALVATSVIASPARASGVLFLTVPGNY